MRGFCCALLLAALLAGCFDTHGPIEDAGSLGDADVEVDAGPGCAIEGFPVEGGGLRRVRMP